jgi:hypothetical protein
LVIIETHRQTAITEIANTIVPINPLQATQWQLISHGLQQLVGPMCGLALDFPLRRQQRWHVQVEEALDDQQPAAGDRSSPSRLIQLSIPIGLGSLYGL